MSENKNTQPATETTSTGSVLSSQVRVIDNPEIRRRQKEERTKGKELSKKKTARKKAAEARRREKEEKQQIRYARTYMEKNNHPSLSKSVLTQEQAAQFRKMVQE